jgi:hypothetical protein
MGESDLFLSLFYEVDTNSFKLKTNVKEDKVDELLFECYRSTLNKSPDYRDFNKYKVYTILIKLDLSQDAFSISSNTGNNVLAYELIKDAIKKWEIIPEELKFDKKTLETVIIKNTN